MVFALYLIIIFHIRDNFLLNFSTRKKLCVNLWLCFYCGKKSKLFICTGLPTSKKQKRPGFCAEQKDLGAKKMQFVRRRVFQNLLSCRSSASISTLARGSSEPATRSAGNGAPPRSPLAAPWAAIQTRGCKVRGSEVILLTFCFQFSTIKLRIKISYRICFVILFIKVSYSICSYHC